MPGLKERKKAIEDAQKQLLGSQGSRPSAPTPTPSVNSDEVVRKINAGEALTPAEEDYLNQMSRPTSKMAHGASLTPKGDIGEHRGMEAKKLFPKVGGKTAKSSSYFPKRPVRQANG